MRCSLTACAKRMRSASRFLLKHVAGDFLHRFCFRGGEIDIQLLEDFDAAVHVVPVDGILPAFAELLLAQLAAGLDLLGEALDVFVAGKLLHDLLSFLKGGAPGLGLDVAIHRRKHFSEMAALKIRSLAGDFSAEGVGLLLVAKLPFNIVGEQDRGIPIMAGDFLHHGSMHRIVILLPERHGLGAVAEELLLAHQIHEDRDAFQTVTQRGHEFGLMPQIGLPGRDEIQGNWEGDENRDQAEISCGKKSGSDRQRCTINRRMLQQRYSAG